MEKSIEERAKEYLHKDGDCFLSGYESAKMDAYIQGATEQKKIDIDKACEWLRNQYPPYMEYDLIIDAMLEDFKKAMEE